MVTLCYPAKAHVTESLNPGHAPGLLCCCHQLTPPINQYTYCVLKNIFRKVLKEICNEQRREVYSVFDGGKSFKYENLQKHASQSIGQSGFVSCASVCCARRSSKTQNQSCRSSGAGSRLGSGAGTGKGPPRATSKSSGRGTEKTKSDADKDKSKSTLGATDGKTRKNKDVKDKDDDKSGKRKSDKSEKEKRKKEKRDDDDAKKKAKKDKEKEKDKAKGDGGDEERKEKHKKRRSRDDERKKRRSSKGKDIGAGKDKDLAKSNMLDVRKGGKSLGRSCGSSVKQRTSSTYSRADQIRPCDYMRAYMEVKDCCPRYCNPCQPCYPCCPSYTTPYYFCCNPCPNYIGCIC